MAIFRIFNLSSCWSCGNASGMSETISPGLHKESPLNMTALFDQYKEGKGGRMLSSKQIIIYLTMLKVDCWDGVYVKPLIKPLSCSRLVALLKNIGLPTGAESNRMTEN